MKTKKYPVFTTRFYFDMALMAVIMFFAMGLIGLGIVWLFPKFSTIDKFVRHCPAWYGCIILCTAGFLRLSAV